MNFDFSEEIISQPILYKNNGVVYGGFIRDLIRGVKASDIDVVIPQSSWDQYVRDMIQAGYVMTKEMANAYDTAEFEKEGSFKVEAIVSEDEPRPDFYIGPTAPPDFDVNLLAFDGMRLYNWAHPSPSNGMDILRIISRIVRNETYQFEDAEPHRVEKMKSKGFKILGVKPSI